LVSLGVDIATAVRQRCLGRAQGHAIVDYRHA
jgi:hypothetical protein